MPCRIQARSSSSCASLRSEVEGEKKTDALDMKSCQKELVESSMVGAIDSSSSSHATIKDPEREQELSSPLSSSSSSVVTLECCREVDRADTMDSESNTSLDDSAKDHQDDAENGTRDPESCSNLTTSTPLVCTNSEPPVIDMDNDL